MKFTQNERDWAQQECQRQGVADEVDNFLIAWEFARRNNVYASEHTDNYIGEVHAYVDWDGNRTYRQTPVVFANGNDAVSWREVPRLMKQLVESGLYQRDIHAFVVEFLRIHPFEDGNGRTATIMLNAALGNQDRFVDPAIPEGWLDSVV